LARPAAVCIISGGLDSICYAATLASDYDVYMMTFAYGQRAKREIERSKYFAKLLKAKDHRIIDINFMKSLYGESNALTDNKQELSQDFSQSLVVPLRNAVFITIATAWAMSINARVVAYGAHTGDTTHYPDCRPVFVSAIAEALNIAESDSIVAGLRHAITMLSPAVLGLDKASLLKAGYETLGDRIFRTWSCYSDGVRVGGDYLHCGRCESCISRKKAFTTAQIEDKTRYATKSRKRKGKAKRDIHKH
jgi:7-cyano-7-deazaguanine synthase